jgi:hypothetical protein
VSVDATALAANQSLTFNSSAELDGLDWQTCAQVKQPGALRSMKLVGGETRRGQPALAQPCFYFSERLDHIAVKQNATAGTDVRQLFHRLKDAGLIVCGHNRNESRVIPNGSIEFIRINPSAVSDGQESDIEGFPVSEMFERMQNSVMFGAGTDQVTAADLKCARQAEDGQII